MLSPARCGTLRPALVREVLARGLTARFTATGDSMEPTLVHGDVILVEPLEDPAPGMVVLCAVPCAAGERMIAHRVVAVGPEALVLQGDAIPTPDRPLPVSALLGLVTAVMRGGRAVPVDGAVAQLSGRVRALLRRVRRSWAGAPPAGAR